MGCTSEKSIPINPIKKDSNITDNDILLDLHDIEKQGECKHPKIEIKNNENKEQEINYYNYKENDLISVNDSKMIVKRIENFDDDEDDESDSEEQNDKEINDINEKNNSDKNEEEEEQVDDNVNGSESKEKEINFDEDNSNKKPEDKKPPDLKKLKKMAKEKIEINIIK